MRQVHGCAQEASQVQKCYRTDRRVSGTDPVLPRSPAPIAQHNHPVGVRNRGPSPISERNQLAFTRHQTTLQRSTDQIPDKVILDLNKLYDEFRALGTALNSKIGRSQSTVTNQGYQAESELMSMSNLKECVQSAADVVSTASTTLAPEPSEKVSVKYGSDSGDVFKKESHELMQRWISSNTIYEYEDAEAPVPDPSETGKGEPLTEYQSDRDSDIENDLVKALFDNGKKRKEEGNLQGAA